MSDDVAASYLIQILLPLFDEQGRPQPPEEFRAVASELTARYGGVTAYTRAPAEGRWRDESAKTSQDEIVLFEVMVPSLDAAWWHGYRRALEQRFRQDQVIIRALGIQLL